MTTNPSAPSRPRFRSRALFLALGVGMLSVLYVGCGGDPTMIDDGEDDDGDDGSSGAASFTKIYNSGSFQTCKQCHAPNAQGKTSGTEATQNWSSRDSAYIALKNGKASGLVGNFAACNGVALIGSSASTSLLVAALDEDVRESFSVGSCDADAISDMTLKIGAPVPASLLADLKSWIDAGAPNN